MSTFFFFVLFCFVCIGPSTNPSMVGKKLNVHAARDGTAAGRHGGAPREHLIFFRKTVPNMNPSMAGKN